MRKSLWMVVALVVVLAAAFFLRQQEIKIVRGKVVTDYLEMTKVMSSFLMEFEISPKVSRPSMYSLRLLYHENVVFQKKYRNYKNLTLYQHNRLGDFSASVDATVKNYFRLSQEVGREKPSVVQQRIKGMNQLLFHNSIYCAMAVGKDKKNLAISSTQRLALLHWIYGTYGGMIVEYSRKPVKPPFLTHILLIRDSLDARKPLPRS